VLTISKQSMIKNTGVSVVVGFLGHFHYWGYIVFGREPLGKMEKVVYSPTMYGLGC
jgi:hypothetical protein